MRHLRSVSFGAVVCATALAACGGGGGSGGAAPPAAPVPLATPSPAPTTTAVASIQSVAGRVVGCDGTYMGIPPAAPSPEPTAAPCLPGTGIPGGTVTIGSLPPAGVGGVPGGSPVPPLWTATTGADGSFTVAAVPPGTYMLQIAAAGGSGCAEGPYPDSLTATPAPAAVGFATSGNYAIFHGKITVTAAAQTQPQVAPPMLVRLTSLTQDEWCEYQQILVDRNRLLGAAAPTTNPVVDEYAQESARQFAIGGETVGVAGGTFSPACGVSEYCDPPQIGAQYTMNGGLFTYADGGVFSNESWESAEFESSNGLTSTSSTCVTNAWCLNMNQTKDVYFGMSEGPNRANFVAVSIKN